MPDKIDHHTFVVAGVVDGAVCKEQAERRYRQYLEITRVHQHRQGEQCTERCATYSKHSHRGCEPDCELIGEWRR